MPTNVLTFSLLFVERRREINLKSYPIHVSFLFSLDQIETYCEIHDVVSFKELLTFHFMFNSSHCT